MAPRPTGNSRERALRALEQHRPDLLKRVKRGQMSAHSAMVKAGLRVPTTTAPLTPEGLARAAMRLPAGEQDALAYLVASGIDNVHKGLSHPDLAKAVEHLFAAHFIGHPPADDLEPTWWPAAVGGVLQSLRPSLTRLVKRYEKEIRRQQRDREQIRKTRRSRLKPKRR